MKGYIPIEIPTKRYIKAYLQSEFGEKPLMNTESHIGSKFYDVLVHKTNEDKKRFSTRYNTTVRLYVSYHTFYQRGAHLNETNIKSFNLFVEEEIKSRYRMYMDFYISMFPNFEANLPTVRKHLGIGFDDWDSDSIKKDYYRYRVRTGKSLLYKNNEQRAASFRGHDPSF